MDADGFLIPRPKRVRAADEVPSADSRVYRMRVEDTPSNSGGVSAAAMAALERARLLRSGAPGAAGVKLTNSHRDLSNDTPAAGGPADRGRSASLSMSRLADARWNPSGDARAIEEWSRAENAAPRARGSTPSRFGPPAETPVVSSALPGVGGSTRGIFGESSEAEVDSDRAFYDAEEFGAVSLGGGYDDGSVFLGDATKFAAREADMARQRSNGEAKLPRMSARKSALIADQEAWEVNRLLTSGAAESTDRGSLALEEEESVHLIVHNRRPPFLEARAGSAGGAGGSDVLSFGSSVSCIRDPSSDMAVMARRGSALLRVVREKRDRAKMRQKFWELGGTKMGDVVGVKAESTEEANEEAQVSNVIAADKSRAEEAILAAAEASAEADAAPDGPEGDEARAKARLAASSSARASAAAAAIAPLAAGASEFSRTKTLSAQRAFLPVYRVRSELLACIAANQIVIVVGETGSGKTTQLAQYLYEEGLTRDGSLVGCTQPRRVAAMSVAKRVAEEMDSELGKLVGYSIRFEDVTCDDTRVKFMTDGVLLRETLRDADLDKYSAIIMDEAHERSLNTDVLFGILRGVAARRRDFRLIVTSATMDSDKFSSFFGGAPIFRIPGRTFPVTKHYAKSVADDYVDAAVRAALTIHVSQPPGSGDILIFMTGQEDIEATCEILAERVETLGGAGSTVMPLLVLPMYSQLPADLQAKIFERSSTGARKVIVSTNIAETSLTVDGVAYVVDPGLAKVKVYNPRIGMDALTVMPISAANADQRAGRAGRTGPGHAYRLYTESSYRRDLLPMQVPEIQRTNLGNVVLLLKSLGVNDVRAFPFMDAPPTDNLAASEYALWVLGALDDAGALTSVGRAMVDFPLDPPLAKMLHAARAMGCTREVATVVSMLSVPSVFFRPRDREAESDAAREKFFVPESDHLTLLNVYNQWIRAGARTEWCSEHFVHAKQMRKAQEVLGQILDLLARQKIPVTSCGGDWDAVRKAVCSGYFYHSARLKGIGEYVNLLSGTPCALHPSSALFGLGYTPNYVVYHELVLGGKEYMSCVTAVEPQWLADLGPAFFAIRGAGGAANDQRWKAAAKEAMAARARDAAANVPLKAPLIGPSAPRSAQATPWVAGMRSASWEEAATPSGAGTSWATRSASTWTAVANGPEDESLDVRIRERSASSARAPAVGTLAQRIAAAKEARDAKETQDLSRSQSQRRFGL